MEVCRIFLLIIKLLILVILSISINTWWKKTRYKMFGLIKKIFIGLLTGIQSANNQTKCMLLSNQKCEFNLLLLIYILINTVKNFTTIHLQFKLNKCVGSCNTLSYLSNKVYVPNKTEEKNFFGVMIA